MSIIQNQHQQFKAAQSFSSTSGFFSALDEADRQADFESLKSERIEEIAEELKSNDEALESALEQCFDSESVNDSLLELFKFLMNNLEPIYTDLGKALSSLEITLRDLGEKALLEAAQDKFKEEVRSSTIDY